MKRVSAVLAVVAIILSFAGCATVSQEAREEALPQMPFPELVQDAQQNIGQTVIVGGYVVSVENLPDQSRIIAVQAPLGVGQEPQSKDKSQGRLILVSEQFIDPEVFTNGRKITAAGKVLGSSATEKPPAQSYPYLRVKIDELHLWPIQTRAPYSYPYYMDPWYDPWWRPYPYPFWWRHPWYW